MIWQDKGFLLSKNKYNENSVIAEFYTENDGKIIGVIFGASSKKIKNYLLIGNKFHLNFTSNQNGKIGYFKVEIDKIYTPAYFDNQKKQSHIETILDKPNKYVKSVDLKNDKHRTISDYISGMTDRFAIQLYKSLK